jgi:hypothetical protein
MKLNAISLAIILAGFAGSAVAGSQRDLPPVHVSAAASLSCEPPSDAIACESFHQWIRANFSQREIGMLFGARTNYPENLTGGIELLHQRYESALQEYVAARAAAGVHVVIK